MGVFVLLQTNSSGVSCDIVVQYSSDHVIESQTLENQKLPASTSLLLIMIHDFKDQSYLR